MNLLLIETGKSEPIFVNESSPHVEEARTRAPGRWGKIKRGVKKTYRDLKERMPYEEQLCSHLRHPLQVSVYHPSQMSAEEAQVKLNRFLRFRHSKHSRWLIADAILACLGILMIPIPGPNIFFFYPAARTLGHYLARKGTARALRLKTLSFQAETLLDQVARSPENSEALQTALAELERRYNIQNLERLLFRSAEK